MSPLFPKNISILKDDTVFCYEYFNTNTQLDSFRLEYFSVKIKLGKYIRTFMDGSYWVIKYKKEKNEPTSSELFIRDLLGGKVVSPKSIFRYDKGGTLTEYYFTIGWMSYSNQCKRNIKRQRFNISNIENENNKLD